VKSVQLSRGRAVTPGWYGIPAQFRPVWQTLKTKGFEIVFLKHYAYAEVTSQNWLVFRSTIGFSAPLLRIKDVEVDAIVNSALAQRAVDLYPGTKEDGSFTHSDILKLLREQKGLCNGCGVGINRRYTVDHIIARSRGGSNNKKNLQLLCGPCNSSKGDRSMVEWVRNSERCADYWGNDELRPVPIGEESIESWDVVRRMTIHFRSILTAAGHEEHPILDRVIKKRGQPLTRDDFLACGVSKEDLDAAGY
jgi:HNH endonuclease